MGEIAEMMLNGTLDCETGEYLGDPCGYPRTAGDMRPDEWHRSACKRTKSQRKQAQRKRAKARKRVAGNLGVKP